MIIIKTQDTEYMVNVDIDKFKGFILPTLLNGFNCFPYADSNKMNDQNMFKYEESEVASGTRVRLSLLEQPYEIVYSIETDEVNDLDSTKENELDESGTNTETDEVNDLDSTKENELDESVTNTETDEDDKKSKKNK